MRLKEKDLQDFAKLFEDLSNGKYRLAVIGKDEDDYLFQIKMEPVDDFDKMVLSTLMASLNAVTTEANVIPSEIAKKDVVLREKKFSAYSNSFLWNTINKEPQ